MKQEAGFTLIEVVASLVIVGIIALFSSLFLVVGLEGYEFTRKAANAAMDAEVALNRISLELKTINDFWGTTPYDEHSFLKYTSSDPALSDPALAEERTIKFDSDNLYISVKTGGVEEDYILIKDVSNPELSIQLEDLDNDGTVNDVAYITVGFKLSGITPPFQVRVYPRKMVAKSW